MIKTNRFINKMAYRLSAVWDAFAKKFRRRWNTMVCEGNLLSHGVVYGKITFDGRPVLKIREGSYVTLGDNFVCKSGRESGSIGNRNHSIISVHMGGVLSIGENTGMSNTAIHCHKSITIGRGVNFGGGVMIFDTDFHSLDWRDRRDGTDIQKRAIAPVVIDDYVFVGADSIILKGVHIGEKSIVGAGSVVSKDIPAGEIWAGNPAKFIKRIND